jgi:PPM family protein phosphatase
VRRVARRKSLAEDLGTTFTMAYITWPDCWILHVGDSRAYLLRDGALHRLTHDHTLAQQLLESEPASSEDPKRYQHLSHVLVNAVGGRTDELDIELHHARLHPGDLLMLCTDGLTGPVGDRDILVEMAHAERPVADIVRRLVARANAAGGRDNVTVVVARF